MHEYLYIYLKSHLNVFPFLFNFHKLMFNVWMWILEATSYLFSCEIRRLLLENFTFLKRNPIINGWKTFEKCGREKEDKNSIQQVLLVKLSVLCCHPKSSGIFFIFWHLYCILGSSQDNVHHSNCHWCTHSGEGDHFCILLPVHIS